MSSIASSTCLACGVTLGPGEMVCRTCGTPVSARGGALAMSPMPGGHAAGSTFSWDHVVSRLKTLLSKEYDILTELGRGGFASVHLAYELALNRLVALKVMSPAVLMGEGMLERAQQEAVTHASLSHRNIVAVHQVRVVEDLFLFVMQYVPGRSLQQVIRFEREAGRPLPLELVRALIYQVGSALDYAHRHGVIHRDIKPANILMSAEGEAVVTDFGIAKVSESPAHTLTGTVVGTAQYMSPEQCYAAEVTGASDQYSLGIVAYELLTGRPPFTGNSFSVMQAQTLQAPPPPTTLRADTPPSFETAVLRMLEKQPEARFPTIPAALYALGAQQVSTFKDDPVRTGLIELAAVDEVARKLGPFVRRGRTPAGGVKQIVSKEQPVIEPPSTIPARLALSGARPVLEVGEDMQLSAVARSAKDDTLTGVAIAWKSTDSRVARVDPARGTVSATGVGRADIVAAAGDAVATIAIEVRAPKVATLVLEGPTDLEAGDTARLVAQARDARGGTIDAPIQWTSSGSSIVVVDAGGSLTARQAGSATITARSGTITETRQVKVTAPSPARVTLTLALPELGVGETTTCAAAVVDKRGAEVRGAAITWRSSDTRVVTVDGSGNVSGVGVGSARVTASAGAVTADAAVAVGVVPLAQLDVEGLVSSMKADTNRRLTVKAIDRAGRTRRLPVTWSSSDTRVVDVDAAGTVYGRAQGEAVLTAHAGSIERSFPIQVTRVKPVTEDMMIAVEKARRSISPRVLGGVGAVVVVTLVAAFVLTRPKPPPPPPPPSPDSLFVIAQARLAAGDTGEARVQLNGITNADVGRSFPPAWNLLARLDSIATARAVKSRDSLYAAANALLARRDTVGARNQLVAITNADIGRTFLPAWNLLARLDSIARVVSGGPVRNRVTAVSIAPIPALEVGTQRALVARMTGGDTQSRLSWSSSNPSVLSVDPTGRVTPRREGTAQITVRVDSVSGRLDATVVEPIAARVVVDGPSRITAGNESSFSASVSGATGRSVSTRTVQWSTSNSAVATVDANGLVKTIAAGTVEIRATIRDVVGSKTLTVDRISTPSTGAESVVIARIAPLEVGEQRTLSARVTGGNEQSRQRWISSKPSVASVDDAGRLTAVAEGTARVTVRVDAVQDELEVTVIEPIAARLAVAGPARLTAGDNGNFSVTATTAAGRPARTRGVRWSTSNSAVATVDEIGVVHAAAAGTVEIRATLGSVADSKTLSVDAVEIKRTSSAFGASEAAAAATVCANRLGGGASTIVTAFADNPARAGLLAALRRSGKIATNAASATHAQDETRATTRFPASVRTTSSSGVPKTVPLEIAATSELQNGTWQVTGCQILGTPPF